MGALALCAFPNFLMFPRALHSVCSPGPSACYMETEGATCHMWGVWTSTLPWKALNLITVDFRG